MEHIVQFAIGIDDEAIKNRIKDTAEKQITEDITKQVRSEIEREIFEFYKSPWEKNEKIIGVQEWVKKLVVEVLDKNEERIVSMAAERLADKLSRTKAIKEAMAAKVTGKLEVKMHEY